MANIFTRFFNLFRSRTPRRQIFQYTVGNETRWADPIQVHKRLVAIGGKDWGHLVNTMSQLMKPLTPMSALALGAEGMADRERRLESAIEQVTSLSRQVFELPSIHTESGKGYLDGEAVKVLAQFLEFMQTLTEEFGPKSMSP